MPSSLTRGLGNLTSLICLSTAAGLAMLGGALLLPVRDNGGTLLGGMGGEYGLYLLLLAWTLLALAWLAGLRFVRPAGLSMGCAMAMAAIVQWLLYPDDRHGQLLLSPSRDELWSLGVASLLLTSPLLLRAPPLPNPLRAGLLIALVLLCSLSLYLLTLFLDTQSAPSECLDQQQRQVRLCIE
jgi:hypothetical protein